MTAVAKGTRRRRSLFSLSLNPPADQTVSVTEFEAAIDRVEKTLGFVSQPQAIVFHEKEGRRHARVVWSRIDTENMKAISLPFFETEDEQDLEAAVPREWLDAAGGLLPQVAARSAERHPRKMAAGERGETGSTTRRGHAAGRLGSL
ncbi:MAG: hypothetical protein AAF899_11275 [Pseudomonadota bacterium]